MKDATESGLNEFQRFRTLLQAAVSVPKSEIDRREFIIGFSSSVVSGYDPSPSAAVVLVSADSVSPL